MTESVIFLTVFGGIFVTWFDVMGLFDLESSWFWQHIVVRALLSAVPGSWVNASEFNFVKGHTSDVMTQLVNLKTLYSPLLTPQLWNGVVAGAAMIYGAIRMRRWRDEG